MTTATTVYVLDHPTRDDRYHTSPDCPMVREHGPGTQDDAYVQVPLWLVERAGLERCTRHGPCQR